MLVNIQQPLFHSNLLKVYALEKRDMMDVFLYIRPKHHNIFHALNSEECEVNTVSTDGLQDRPDTEDDEGKVSQLVI